MAQHGDIVLRKEVVDATIKGMAERLYKFKQAVSIVPTSAISNIFWTEEQAVLTAKGAGNSFNKVPFGANFPVAKANFTRNQSLVIKHAWEDNIAWELIKSSEIDIQGRTMFKGAEAITKSVDDHIYTILTEDYDTTGGVPANINLVDVGVTKPWTNASSAGIVDDLMKASQLMADNFYATGNLIGSLSPRDKRSIMNYLYTKGSHTPSIATDVALNGFITKLAGIDLIESTSVTASSALIVVPRICATFKQFEPLTTDTTIDPLKNVRMRAIEEGICQLTDPKAVTLIIGTQKQSEL